MRTGDVYIVWKRRKRATSDDHSLIPYLTKSARVDGQPRQRQVYLGSIREKYATIIGQQHRLDFWDGVLRALERHNIVGEVRDELIFDIEAKVPRPDEAEVSEIVKTLHDRGQGSMEDLCERYRHVLI
jgi:hypothetical protein